jgi:predicted nucleic-acid-binding protein
MIGLDTQVQVRYIMQDDAEQSPQATALVEFLTVEFAEIVWQSARLFRDGTADLADCLIARSAVAAGCERTMTFDRGAAKACGMTLIQ